MSCKIYPKIYPTIYSCANLTIKKLELGGVLLKREMKNSVVAGEVKLRDSWFYTHIHTHEWKEGDIFVF